MDFQVYKLGEPEPPTDPPWIGRLMMLVMLHGLKHLHDHVDVPPGDMQVLFKWLEGKGVLTLEHSDGMLDRDAMEKYMKGVKQ